MTTPINPSGGRPSLFVAAKQLATDAHIEALVKQSLQRKLSTPTYHVIEPIGCGGMTSAMKAHYAIANRSPIAGSIVAGDVDEVERLLSADTSLLTWRDREGSTLLHLAFASGHGGVTRLLLHRAETLIHAVNESGATPLHMVAGECADVADEALVKRLIHTVDAHGNTPLHAAAFHRVIVESFFVYGDIEKYNERGETPLHIAAQDPAFFEQILISDKVPRSAAFHQACHAEDAKGKTPLERVCEHAGLSSLFLQRLYAISPELFEQKEAMLRAEEAGDTAFLRTLSQKPFR